MRIRRLLDPATPNGDSLPYRSIHARRRDALTAPAVFDGDRAVLREPGLRRCLQNLRIAPPLPKAF